MNITTLNFSKTIQTAQYEPETLEVGAVLDEGENLDNAIKSIRETVYAGLGRRAGKTTAARTTAGAAKSEAKEDAKDDAGESKEAAKKTTKKASKQSKASGGSAKGKTSRKKNVTYNREVKDHKAAVGKLLHEHFPGWKEDADLAAAAKSTSMDLHGEDFMDGEGNVLDSFVESLKEKMSGDDL